MTSTPSLAEFSDVVVGGYAVCGIRTDDGFLECWGKDAYGQISEMPEGVAVERASIGTWHSCAILADTGEMRCWGDDRYSQVTETPSGVFTSVSSGYRTSCGIRDTGAIVCWGSSETLGTAPAGVFKELSIGAHSCAIRADDTVACWGATPAPPPTNVTFKEVEVYSSFACGIRTLDDGIQCWGDNNAGQVSGAPEGLFTKLYKLANVDGACALRDDGERICWGDTIDEERYQVAGFSADTPVRDVRLGYYYGCVLDEDGVPYCWGEDVYNGVSDTPNEQLKAIDVGTKSACGIRQDDTLVCWGDDREGQSSPPPGTYARVVLAGYAACAERLSDRTITCWGADNDGEVSEAEAGPLLSLQGGWFHFCGIRPDDHTVVCWGQDSATNGVPTEPVRKLDVGGENACVVYDDDSVYCWGTDDLQPPPGVPFENVDVGDHFACGIRADTGAIQCFGDMPYTPHRESVGYTSDRVCAPQTVGEPDEFEVLPPTATSDRVLATLTTCASDEYEAAPPIREDGFVDIEAGRRYVCGTRVDGTVDCWGGDDYRVSGAFTSTPSLAEFKQIAPGGNHVCGIRIDDDELECWGKSDSYGEVSDAPKGLPVTSVTSGTWHSCAIRESDSRVVCWGDDRFGQVTGVPTEPAVSVASGYRSACAVLADGALACWGDTSSSYGFNSAAIPLGTFSSVSNGNHFCALRTDGTPACWGGTNLYGETTTEPMNVNFRELTSFSGFACGIRVGDDGIQCWGRDDHGQVSDAPAGRHRRLLTNGARAACAETFNDDVICWGQDGVDRQVAGDFQGVTLRKVVLSYYWGCVLHTDGQVECWGDRDEYSQVSGVPSESFEDLFIGSLFACGQRADGTLRCWGDNRGTITQPPQVPLWKVDLSGYGGCGLDALGETVCWGSDAYSELSAMPADPLREIHGGSQHYCGIRKTDDTVVCWGRDDGGQVSGAPAQPVKALSAGGVNSCAILQDGTVRCWGPNNLSPESSASPLAPDVGAKFTHIDVGDLYVCGLRADTGAMQCWWGLGYEPDPAYGVPYTEDRVCAPVTTCEAGEVELLPPTATDDRVCVPAP